MKTARKRVKKEAKKKTTWEFRLYVANRSPRSLLAIANLESLCERYLKDGYHVRIIDVQKEPKAVFRDDILATPTLVRVSPEPQKTVIGCLSDVSSVVRGLDLARQPLANDLPIPTPVVMQEMGAA